MVAAGWAGGMATISGAMSHAAVLRSNVRYHAAWAWGWSVGLLSFADQRGSSGSSRRLCRVDMLTRDVVWCSMAIRRA